MYAEPIRSLIEVRTVLDNLCDDTVLELRHYLGKHWKSKTFQIIRAIKKEKFIIKLKENGKPVGLYGLVPVNEHSGGIFLLTCDDLHKGNIITFLKSARKQVDSWLDEYKLIMDSWYKKNETIKKWLILLHFKPSEFEDDNFQVWYKGDISYFKG
ncbi:MAG: hypothetical protein IKN62_05345 [Elusimicrobia bacterium]|nr:hypothetical protein [Elusimicrobiota bacterium]